MRTTYVTILGIAVLGFCLSVNAFAQEPGAYRSVTDGNWNAGSTCSGATVASRARRSRSHSRGTTASAGSPSTSHGHGSGTHGTARRRGRR